MKKYNLEILSFIMFSMVSVCVVFDIQLSLIQRIMLAYMFLFTLHEWEENRIPGGFAELMSKFFGINTTEEQREASHIPVAVLLILITFVPFFTNCALLSLIPVYLGVFEAIIHVAGIKLHKMKKPYTPGLVTALCLLAASICVLNIFSENQMVSTQGLLLGIPLMFVCFFAMQRTVIAIFGLGYKDLLKMVKSKIKGVS